MDAAIRKLSLSEQALEAARRSLETGIVETNPYGQTADGDAWSAAFSRWLIELASADVEGSA